MRRLAPLAVLLLLAAGPAGAEERLAGIRLPPGFAIELFARVPGARSLAPAPELGLLFVGSRGDAIHAVELRPDGRAGAVRTALGGLNVPNGIAWRDGFLYVAEQHRLVRFRIRGPADLGAAAEPEVLYDRLPDKRWHGWRYAGFGPDGRLYVAVGAPCNVCRVSGLEGTIVRFAPEGGPPEVYARGVRNSVGLDFHPRTGELYFTDNGADFMGDDEPPDELNHAPQPGLHFGFPYFGGGRSRTAEFRDEPPPGPTVPPAVAFGAHVAALGLHFYRGARFPAEYRTDAFVAQHGSWNRTVPDGYRVVRVRMTPDGRALGHEPFAEGWLMPDGRRWGRPVDIKELPDGSLLVSDDHAGAVWRISYGG
jgi:glucose/arabinose dehydrogenase